MSCLFIFESFSIGDLGGQSEVFVSNLFQDYLGFFLPPKSFLCTVPSVPRSCSRIFIHLEKAALHEVFFSLFILHHLYPASAAKIRPPTTSDGEELSQSLLPQVTWKIHHIPTYMMTTLMFFYAIINKTHHTAEAKADAASSQVRSPKKKSSSTSKQDAAATASPVGKSDRDLPQKKKGVIVWSCT